MQQPRLFKPPAPPPDPDSTATPRENARIILQANLAAQNPTRDPQHLQAWFRVPYAASSYLSRLTPSSQVLYMTMWRLAHRFTDFIANRWWSHTDDLLTINTGLSEASLKRARRSLREAGLAYITTAGPEKRPTHYAIRWPLPLDHRADDYTRLIQAQELQAGGEPWTPIAAWLALAATVQSQHRKRGELSQIVAYAQEVAAALSPRRPHLLRNSISRLREQDPWLLRQLLHWGAPDADAFPKSSPKMKSRAFAPPSRT